MPKVRRRAISCLKVTQVENLRKNTKISGFCPHTEPLLQPTHQKRRKPCTRLDEPYEKQDFLKFALLARSLYMAVNEGLKTREFAFERIKKRLEEESLF